jgi:hypothetical protein
MNTKKRRNWNALQPSSLRQALELCKEYARERRNLSVERIAEKWASPTTGLFINGFNPGVFRPT